MRYRLFRETPYATGRYRYIIERRILFWWFPYLRVEEKYRAEQCLDRLLKGQGHTERERLVTDYEQSLVTERTINKLMPKVQ